MRSDLWANQVYSIIGAGVVAFALWTHGLNHWPTSRVMLFVNLIPLTTVLCSRIFLNETVQIHFWYAMLCVMLGVFLGLANLNRLKRRWLSS